MIRVLSGAAWCCSVLAVACLILGVVATPVGHLAADQGGGGGPPGPNCTQCVLPCVPIGQFGCVLPPGPGAGGINGANCSASCVCDIDANGNRVCFIPLPGGGIG